jgi:hypothetical protein
MSDVKGPNCFGEEPNKAFPEFYKNEKNFLSLFSNAKEEKILGEASHYFWSETAPEEIIKFNPEAKIVILLRDPVDIIFNYYKTGAIPNEIPIEESLKQETPGVKELMKNIDFPSNLNRFLKTFGKENVHILMMKEMLDNREEEFARLCTFLKIDNTFSHDFEGHNLHRDLKNKWILRLLDAIPTTMKVGVKSILSSDQSKKIRNSIIKFTTKKPKKITLDPETRKRLDERYKELVVETEKIIGREIA